MSFSVCNMLVPVHAKLKVQASHLADLSSIHIVIAHWRSIDAVVPDGNVQVIGMRDIPQREGAPCYCSSENCA
ncbi:MAG: hypothetical protein A2V87_10890 [Deltaproteobacteria bacterium RBG_16_58_17]|nr:MAG: hypothetical protein A2V87_10890 [Deltaproteobacteria bacterium RBG_16_58_17]